MAKAAESVRAERDAYDEDLTWFDKVWDKRTVKAGVPQNYRATVRNYLVAGLDRSDLLEAIDATSILSPYSPNRYFPYFCGVCRNKVEKIRVQAEAILAEEVTADGT